MQKPCVFLILSPKESDFILKKDSPWGLSWNLYTSLLNGGEAAGAGLGVGVVPEDADLVADAVPVEDVGLAGVEPAVDAGYCWDESSRWFVRNCLRAEPFH